MPKIEELYAFVVADTNEDDEGVPAFKGPDGTYMPMMGADLERAQQLRPMAETLVSIYGKPIKLIRSTGIEVVEIIE